jgi:hypothetical protein
VDELRDALRTYADPDGAPITLDEVRARRADLPSGLNGTKPSRPRPSRRMRRRWVLGVVTAAAAAVVAVVVVSQAGDSGPDRITEQSPPVATEPEEQLPSTTVAPDVTATEAAAVGEPFGASIDIGAGTPLDTGRAEHQAVLTQLGGTFEGTALFATPIIADLPPRVAIGWFEGTVAECGTGAVALGVIADGAGQVRWEVLGGFGTRALQHLAASGTGTWPLGAAVGTLGGEVDCDGGGPDHSLETTLIGPPPEGEPTPPIRDGSDNAWTTTKLELDPTLFADFPGIDFIDGESNAFGPGLTSAVWLHDPDGVFLGVYLGEHVESATVPCEGFSVPVVLIQHFLNGDYLTRWEVQPDLSGGLVGGGSESAGGSQGAMRCP